MSNKRWGSSMNGEFAHQVEIKGHTYSVKDPVVVHTHLGKKIGYVSKINGFRHMISVSFPESQSSSTLPVTFPFERIKPCVSCEVDRNQLLAKIQERLRGASDQELANMASRLVNGVVEYKSSKFSVHSC